MNTRLVLNCLIFIIKLFFFSAISILGQEKSILILNLVDTEHATVKTADIQIKEKSGLLIYAFTALNDKDFEIHKLEAKKEYILEIKASGFKSVTTQIKLDKGQNAFSVMLEIEEIKFDIKVEQNIINKRVDESLTRTWTLEEIDNLPNSPTDIEKEIKRRYGDDIIIRVNGFEGRIPTKSQIALLRVIRSSFDAEFHQIGQTIVDIQTKAGGSFFYGIANVFYDNSIFNARDPISGNRIPSQNLNGFVLFTFPTIKNRTSFSAGLSNFVNSSKQNIVAIIPSGKVGSDINSKSLFLSPNLSVTHNINKEHTLFINYFLYASRFSNLGVGELNLPEKSFSSDSQTNTLRLTESGSINKTANQFRLEYSLTKNQTTPNNQAVAINVIGAFNGGGANSNNSNNQKRLALTDINYFDYKKHAFKIGGELEYNQYKLDSSDNLNGRFTFSSLEDYLNNKPYSYVQRQQSVNIILSQNQFSGFIQDEIRLHKRFQVGLGLRYEWQNNLNDKNNFSPRLSFTWAPDREARLVIRSGAGLFYHWLETSTLSTILGNDGRNGSDIIILNPSYPNPFLSGTTAQPLPPSILQKDDNLINPYTFIAKTGFNYRINNKYNLEGFYTYRKGIHQFRSRDINSPIEGIRVNSDFGRIVQVESSGNLLENNLELRLDGKLKKGFSFDVNYKLGKILSDFEDIFGMPMDNYNTKQEWAVSNLDQRHRFNTRLTFPSWEKFSLFTIFRLESPRPYTITTGFDENNDSVINDRPLGIGRNTERGDWLKQTDLNLNWRTKIGKEDDKNPLSKMKNQMTFSLSVQNIFNHTNKQNFVGIQTSPFFRHATFAAPARTIQFGLSWMF